MKKIIAGLVVFMLIFALTGCTQGDDTQTPASSEKLVIYNWADYIDEGDPDSNRAGLIDAFREYYYKATGKRITVEYNTFETNEELVTKVMLSDADMDLICPSEYTIEKLLRNGMLSKINKDKITNFDNVDNGILDTISLEFGSLNGSNGELYDMTEYMIPYMWGTLGILYNTEVVTEEDIAQGYGLLWNKANNPALNKKILMKDSVRDSYVAAILYAKEEGKLPQEYHNYTVQQLINTINRDLLAVVEDVLIEQGSLLYGYEVDFGKDDMVKGNAYVDLAWSGDAIYAIEEGEMVDVSLDYFIPEIGGNIWFDGWVIPQKAKNVKAAEMFIDFMCDPVNAIYNMMYIGYTASINKELLENNDEITKILEYYEYDPEEFFSNPIRYPEITDSLGVMKDFGKEADAAIMMWESIKPYKTTELFIIIAIIIGITGIAIGAYFLNNYLKIKPRKIR